MAATKIASFALPSSRIISYALTQPPPSPSSPARGTVLLSNSLTAPFSAWDLVVRKITALGFAVLRYDQPGHGESGVPSDLSSTTFDSLATDARELLSHLRIEKLHAWVGVSMGAATGIVFASKYPGIINRLIPCDTISCSPVNAGVADAFGPRVAAAREAGSLKTVVESTLERWFGGEWMRRNESETTRMRNIMMKTSIDGFETCCAALRSKTFDLRLLAKLAGQGVDRALLIAGEKDANVPQTMEELRREVEAGLAASGKPQEVKLKIISNAGHVSYIDGFEQFCEEVTAFIKND